MERPKFPPAVTISPRATLIPQEKTGRYPKYPHQIAVTLSPPVRIESTPINKEKVVEACSR